MKKFLFLIFFTFLFADNNITSVFKQIPKTSPDYTLASAIVKKIKTLKPQTVLFDANVTDQWDYEKKFLKLAEFKKELISLPDKIEDLQNKIDYLKENNSSINELQIIFYQTQLNILKNRLDFLKNNFEKYEKTLFNNLKQIKFDTNYAQKQINYWNNLLIQKKKEYEKLNINLQKWEILNNRSNINSVENYIKINIDKQKKIYQNLINNYLIIWFAKLQKKDRHIFDLTKQITGYAKFIDETYSKALNDLMFDFEKFRFGSKILIYQSKNGIKIILSQINSFINYPLFKLSDKTITPLDFIIMLIVIIIGWLTGKYYKKLIYSLRKKYDISYSTATLLANMGYYFILTLTFLIALKSVGLNLSSLAIIAGALSVGIGFGLQNIVSNFVSGIILMFEKSIKIGDYIQIDENTRGEIIDISMRSTVIRTNDNIDIIVPNQNFIQNNVINWTMRDDLVRFRVPFGVEYGSDINKVEEVVLDALEKSDLPFIRAEKFVESDVSPRVVFMDMGSSSLDFELFVWVKGEYAKRPRRTRSKFLKLIYNALMEAKIGIPFPQQDLHIKDSVPFEVRIKRDERE